MSVLDLEAAKDWLNITVDTYDEKVQAVIDSAVAAIGRKVGPLEVAEFTSRVRGGSCALVLPVLPVVEITEATGSDSSTVDPDTLVVSAVSGVVEYATTGLFSARSYTVEYTAGWGVTDEEDGWDGPDDLLQAVREMVRHLWEPQRGSGVRPGATPADALSNTLAASAFVFPIHVQQLIEPYVPLGGA